MHKCASRSGAQPFFPCNHLPPTQGLEFKDITCRARLGVTSIAKVGTYAYVNPIVAVLLGWAVLGEAVSLRTVVAAAVILLGVARVNVDWRGRSP